MERGILKARNITVSTTSPETKKPIIVETVLSGKGDPGYSLTASASLPPSPSTIVSSVLKVMSSPLVVMIAESALALLKPAKLTPIAQEGGVLTPMSALGDVLIKRLKATGRFEVESEVVEQS